MLRRRNALHEDPHAPTATSVERVHPPRRSSMAENGLLTASRGIPPMAADMRTLVSMTILTVHGFPGCLQRLECLLLRNARVLQDHADLEEKILRGSLQDRDDPCDRFAATGDHHLFFSGQKSRQLFLELPHAYELEAGRLGHNVPSFVVTTMYHHATAWAGRQGSDNIIEKNKSLFEDK